MVAYFFVAFRVDASCHKLVATRNAQGVWDKHHDVARGIRLRSQDRTLEGVG